MHLFLTAPCDEPFLLDELKRTFGSEQHELLAPALVRSDVILQPAAPPTQAFARQVPRKR